MMASEYKKRGGGYTTDKNDKDETQKHLDNWTEEDWQTKDGSGHAKKDDGTEKRYLPEKAWEQMSEQDKEETDAKKQEASKQGQQHVPNTPNAKQTRKNASRDGGSNGSGGDQASSQQSDMRNATGCHEHWENPEHLERNLQAYKKFQDHNRKSAAALDEAKVDAGTDGDHHEGGGKKRGRGANASSPNKKQKSTTADHDKPNGPAGDKNRVPKKGQKVQWTTVAGYIDGDVVEVVYEEKKVDGKAVKGSKEDPRVVLKSDASGKIIVHKPEAVYFD